jgi:hypothetical protein
VHLDSAARFCKTVAGKHLNHVQHVKLSWKIEGNLFNTEQFNFSRGQGSRQTQIKKYMECRDQERAWQEFCRTLSTLCNLRSVDIRITDSMYKISERSFLAPLYRINSSETFVVKIPWQNSLAHPAMDPIIDKTPFELRRIATLDTSSI